jgi:hypothetical protein
MSASGIHRHANPLVALPQPRYRRNAQQHHPGFADDLRQQELKAAESQEQKDCAVDDQAHETTCHDR